ncbi:MAG: EamA family transporter [bacterium]
MDAHRPDRLTLAAFAATVVFLGSNFVAVRFSNQELAPFWGGAVRFALATVILVAIVAGRRIAWPRGKALVGAVLFGLLAFAANFGLLYWALRPGGVPAGVASIVYATIPLTTFVLAVAMGMERFRWAGLAGAVVVVAGTGLVVLSSRQAAVPLGPLLAVVAASLCAAMSGIVVKRTPRSHPLAFNAVAMAVGASVLYAACRIQGDVRAIPQLQATWLALAWLVASSIVAFGLMVWILGRWTASAQAYSGVLAPMVTIPVAAWLSHETVGASFAAGAVLVLAGVYVGTIWGVRRPPVAPPVPAASPPQPRT